MVEKFYPVRSLGATADVLRLVEKACKERGDEYSMDGSWIFQSRDDDHGSNTNGNLSQREFNLVYDLLSVLFRAFTVVLFAGDEPRRSRVRKKKTKRNSEEEMMKEDRLMI